MRENKQKRVCDEYNTTDFLEGGNRRSSTSVGLTWEANPVQVVFVGLTKAW